MDWSRFKVGESFEKRGSGRHKNVTREYVSLVCPLCRDPQACTVLRRRMTSLRPRAARDHLAVCPSVPDAQKAHFRRNTVQQLRAEMPPPKKEKPEARAQREAHKWVQENSTGGHDFVRGGEPGEATDPSSGQVESAAQFIRSFAYEKPPSSNGRAIGATGGESQARRSR